MKIQKLFVGLAGLVAAASLVGLGAGAAFTDQASATQRVAVGNINLQVSADGDHYGKTAVFDADANISGWGTGLITEKVWLRNTGSLRVSATPVVETSGELPVEISQLRFDYAPYSLVSETTLQPGQTSMFTFTYQVHDLDDSNKGQSARITVMVKGLG